MGVLVVLPSLALWAAIVTYNAGSAAKSAIQISAALEKARFAVGAEESQEQRYFLAPGADVRTSHARFAAEMAEALREVEELRGRDDRLEGVIAMHVEYLRAIGRMFDAIDANDAARANAIDSEETDPVFDKIQYLVSAEAEASRADAMRQLETLGRIQTRVLTTAPVVILFGLGLVVVFWRVLRNLQRQAQDAILREADAARLREQRFRSLVQNAADMILICDAPGSITYQSPAAEAGWGYAGSALLGRPLGTLAHPDAWPALTALLEQLQGRSGPASPVDAARSIELQMMDGNGQWRWVQLILTNLLHDPAVAGMVATIRDIQERRAFEQQLTQQAFYDGLTGLPNRLLFRDRLEQAVVRASRDGSQVGVLFLDLDNFKLVNDSLGHPVGDELLIQTAARLQCCIRSEDTVARLGGDEFVVVLEHLPCEADAISVAEAIAKQFSRKFVLDGRDVMVTASVGIALGAAGEKQAENLLRNADVAMYRAKSGGKSRYVVFDDSMHTDSLARLELENDLRRAIAEGELRVHYQPIVSMPSGRIEGVEALVRWQHPERGLIA
ncbi:MAG: putative bifunctional diguanylate cyclase/phosphodiesterase, partial [Janthinobacterium lividum]